MDNIDILIHLKDLRSIKMKDDERASVLKINERFQNARISEQDIKKIKNLVVKYKDTIELLNRSRERAIKSMAGIVSPSIRQPTKIHPKKEDLGF